MWAWALLFILPFARLSGLFVTAPLVSDKAIPIQIKVLLIASLAILVAMSRPLSHPTAQDSLSIGLLIAGEALLGLFLGFAIKMLWLPFETSMDMLGSQMGFGFAQFYDPIHGEMTNPMTRVGYLLGLVIFIGLGGLEASLVALIKSMNVIELGAHWNIRQTSMQLVLLTTQSLAYTLLLFFPALCAVLASNVVLGIISRAAPQLNLFSVGFQVFLLSGFGMLFLGSDLLRTLMPRLYEAAFEALDLALARAVI